MVHDICGRSDPLIHLNLREIAFAETEYWKYNGREYKKKKMQEEKNKLESFKSVYSLIQC
jgi:hypothetical protein